MRRTTKQRRALCSHFQKWQIQKEQMCSQVVLRRSGGVNWEIHRLPYRQISLEPQMLPRILKFILRMSPVEPQLPILFELHTFITTPTLPISRWGTAAVHRLAI